MFLRPTAELLTSALTALHFCWCNALGVHVAALPPITKRDMANGQHGAKFVSTPVLQL